MQKPHGYAHDEVLKPVQKWATEKKLYDTKVSNQIMEHKIFLKNAGASVNKTCLFIF